MVVQTMAGENFLALPHPEVANDFRNKAQDYDRWLGGMQKVHAQLSAVGSCPAADHVEQPAQDPLAIGPQAVVGVLVGDPGPQPANAAGRLLGK